MARRESASPTLEEIEDRIEPDFASAYPTQDLTDADIFNDSFNEYFEDKTEIKYSDNARRRIFNVHRLRKGKEYQELKKQDVVYSKVKRKDGTTKGVYRRKGKFISKREVETYKKNVSTSFDE
jgi:hypothetical protein